MQSITVCKQPPVRTFLQKRKIETHKIRLIIFFVHWFDIVQFEWRMGISDWNWSILHIWLVRKRYKWFTLFTFISKIKENRSTRCKFFKLEISCKLQTLKFFSENLMASWKIILAITFFLGRVGPWVGKVMMHGWTRNDSYHLLCLTFKNWIKETTINKYWFFLH